MFKCYQPTLRVQSEIDLQPLDFLQKFSWIIPPRASKNLLMISRTPLWTSVTTLQFDNTIIMIVDLIVICIQIPISKHTHVKFHNNFRLIFYVSLAVQLKNRVANLIIHIDRLRPLKTDVTFYRERHLLQGKFCGLQRDRRLLAQLVKEPKNRYF